MMAHGCPMRSGSRYQDFDDGSGNTLFKWNMTLHGPIVGLVITF
jgi:hypothetical protein